MSYPVILPNAHLYEAIADERARQERLRIAGKFPFTCGDRTRSSLDKLPVLVEEVGEVARAVLQEHGTAVQDDARELREELIQVAAVCMAWLESLEES